MARKYKQGKYYPQNPEKYSGDVDKIIYRSSWELNYFKYCDTNRNVLKWSSESVVIPYLSPVDNDWHRYFMDIWLKYRTRAGDIEEALIEIKPFEQTQPPKPQKRKTKVFLEKVKTYAVNQAKWRATKKFCKKRGLKFDILTEKGFIGYR